MAVNSLYPGFIKYFYTSAGHPHVMTQPVKPYAAVGGEYFLPSKTNVVGVVWTSWVEDFVVEWKKWFPTTASMGRAELWTMASPTAEPVFIASEIIGEAGVNGSTASLYTQAQMTFRSQTGGLFRLQLMEPTLGANLEYYPPMIDYFGTMAALLTGDDSPVVARDGGFLNAPIRLLTKTNDKLREKYLLDA